jgi:MGT family glycosyltransferase
MTTPYSDDGGAGPARVFLVVCLPERGAYYATFALARTLEARGHAVIYAGTTEFAGDVERQGFRFVPMFPEVSGSDPDVGEIPTSRIGRWLYYYKQARRNPQRQSWLLRAIVEGEFETILSRHRIDVVLLDSFMNVLAVVCRRLDVKVISVATELINYRDYAVPPNFSSYTPTDSLASRLTCYFLWGWHFLLTYWRRAVMFGVTTALFLPKPTRTLLHKFAQLKRDARIRRVFSEYSWRFELPEIVLGPRAFDFAVARHANGRRYLGPAIDRLRAESPLPDGVLPRDAKIVYVSLGTHAALYGRLVDRFILQVLDVARQRPKYFFIINIGKGNDAAKYGDCGENGLMLTFVPQLQILDRCDAIITNGGLGTVKEAIMAEVPMLVVPCRWDQFGNAARVRHHGIGDFCDIRTVTSQGLLQKLEDVLLNSRYRHAIAAMRTKIEGDREFTQGVEWIERLVMA